MSAPPNISDIREAADRIAPHIHRTPVVTSRYFDNQLGSTLFFKCENFQRVGAFKYRGACNAVLSLSGDEASKGVVTHSSGNHAQALALAAKTRGIKATIVMPRNAPRVKVAAVKDYDAEIVFCEPTLDARESVTQQIIDETGATMIHPYNDPRIIAGQGTACLELQEQVPDLDVIVAPVGGGGLLSGTAIAARDNTVVLGAEPTGADDAHRSYYSKAFVPSLQPKTVADGLLTSLGDITFPIILQSVSGILLASERSIILAMKDILERMKMVVEPSGSVPIAAIQESTSLVESFVAKPMNQMRIGIIVSGGNLDLLRIPELLNADQ